MTDDRPAVQVSEQPTAGCICPGCTTKVPAWWVSGMCYPCANADCEHDELAGVEARPPVPATDIRLAIQTLNVEPGDIIVLKLTRPLSAHERQAFSDTAIAQLKLAGIGSRVLVLDDCVNLAIIRERDKVLAAQRIADQVGGKAAPCLYCERPLVLTEGREWIHFGGGAYVVRCGVCTWSDSPAAPMTRCGKCGATALRDDHIATPQSVLEEARQIGSL